MRLLSLFLWVSCSIGPLVSHSVPLDPDDLLGAARELQNQRSQVLTIKNSEERIQSALDLGLWDQARLELNDHQGSRTHSLLIAHWLMLQSRFAQASKIVDSILEKNHSYAKALVLKGELLMESWKLKEAEIIFYELALRNPKTASYPILLAQTYFLEGQFKEMRERLVAIEAIFPGQAGVDLLWGRYYLYLNQPPRADSVFRHGLEKNPLNADLRFYFGYTYWRMAKDNDLTRMQSQWDFCLLINPLHVLAHWHLGNGHVQQPLAGSPLPNSSRTDEMALKQLSGFDPLFYAEDYPSAIAVALKAEANFPSSVWPLLYRASAYYQMGGSLPGKSLDSAERLFLRLLTTHSHFGPAHNGLAAVLNVRNIPTLYFYDSVNKVLAGRVPSDPKRLHAVFPETGIKPSRMGQLIDLELNSAAAYLPLLQSGKWTFHIMPLHHGLAETMNDPYFKYNTTFDHRWWNDIRGVGKGAVGIEYLQKGAFYERNVFLHEFIHLVHGVLITDGDKRKIRRLYMNARKKNIMLDYYASANENEYFAQIYPAFFTPLAVNPQDFKSFNTSALLRQKDPLAYRFIDSLQKVERRALGGDASAFKDQWCELYLHLAEKCNLRTVKGRSEAKAFLDTAAIWDKSYLPLQLAIATLNMQTGEFSAAEEALRTAESIDPGYSPIYEKNYELNKRLSEVGLLDYTAAAELQLTYLVKAISTENDPEIKEQWQMMLVRFYLASAQPVEALAVLDSFLEKTILYSTGQQDRWNEALAEKVLIRARLGYGEGLTSLEKICQNRPQQPGLFLKYAQALDLLNPGNKTAEGLEKLSLSLISSDRDRSFSSPALIAYLKARAGNTAVAEEMLTKIAKDSSEQDLYVLRTQLLLHHAAKARTLFAQISTPVNPAAKGEYFDVKGDLELAEGKPDLAIESYEASMASNAYNFQIASKLARLLKDRNRIGELDRLKKNLLLKGVKPLTTNE